MAAYQPLFTSTGLILWNIMKTAQDIYTITIKQIVRLQERMHFEKNSKRPSSKWPLIGHYSLSHGRYLVNRARWLETITVKRNVRFQMRMHLEKI